MEKQQPSSTPAAELKCDHCNKIFGQRKNLNQHMARVHNGQRYKCDICEVLLSSGFRLKTHMQSAHKKKSKIKFVKSHLVKQTKDGHETPSEAKKYIIREQADKIRQLETKISKTKSAIVNLRKKIATGTS